MPAQDTIRKWGLAEKMLPLHTRGPAALQDPETLMAVQELNPDDLIMGLKAVFEKYNMWEQVCSFPPHTHTTVPTASHYLSSHSRRVRGAPDFLPRNISQTTAHSPPYCLYRRAPARATWTRLASARRCGTRT